MNYFRCIGNSGGGGTSDPIFNEALLCDNSALSSTINLTDDITNYDFINVIIYNSSSSIYTSIVTTPEFIENAFLYSSNLVNFNEFNNNQYCCYSKTSSLQWSRYNNRNCNIFKIYGMTCINKTVTKTVLYNRQAITTGSVPITSQTSLFDYDFIFSSCCSGNVDETMPCNEYITMPKADLLNKNKSSFEFVYNRYANYNYVTISEYQMSSSTYYFFVIAVKFT